MRFMLNSYIGVLLYFILPYNYVWNLLSEEEKDMVLTGCYKWNNLRYVRPEDYDREHNITLPAGQTKEGKIIQYLLDKYSPSSVLDIGPGNGLYSRLFLDYPSVKEYTAVDIVESFIRYIEKNVISDNEKAKINLICGDFLKYSFNKKFDLIIFLSTLHHIPNRVDFIKKCASLLSERGRIVFVEPRHGIPRIWQLIRKYFKYYCKKSFWLNRDNFRTHHSLTFTEIKYLARKCGLKISELSFFSMARGDRHLSRIFKPKIGFFSCSHFIPFSLFAQYVYVILEKE